MSDHSSLSSKSRNLILCFDGTSSEYSSQNTNVVKFFSLLEKGDSEEQLCYYQAGVGTYFDPGAVSPLLQWGAKILDEAFAWYLPTHVMEGYRFIMQNYRPDDKISIFGFSRGAYTARAVAGMLYKVGLLPKDNDEQIPFAYKLYSRTDDEGIELAAGFKTTYCSNHSVKIEFMGVWDTVSSVGVITTRSLPFTDSNTAVKTFRHAVAIDERRTRFRANLFHRSTGTGDDMNVGSLPKKLKGRLLSGLSRKKQKEADIVSASSSVPKEDDEPNTNVLVVTATSAVAPWMVREVIKSQCGVLFRDDALAKLSIPRIEVPSAHAGRTTKAPLPVQVAPAELDETQMREMDKPDALTPVHDRLSLGKDGEVLWWVLEVIPMRYWWQDADCVWHETFE
ncbi:hypothetical protein AAF712_013198 [Marasmius tenuissimus]|uniref:T6SS Phospholipase effector Tle1-like catalytic domain-containing protein n=1 Tax=Marasmius tenuissimus TaxID=585030 RepID=A0ABR2ZFN6_9AGAR